MLTPVQPGPKPDEARSIKALRGDDDDLRAMKRALANAPLGPKATLALTAAIIAIEEPPSSEV
jgi:hypothetical protein